MSSAGELELVWWGPGTVPPPASIVWCNFPQSEALGQPGPKSRPALVFKARAATDPPGDRFYVLVAYGTSVLKSNERQYDYSIINAAELDILRLPQATRFDLDRMLWLPWARPFFAPRNVNDPLSTPTISVMLDSMKRDLGWTMALRDAEGLNDAYHCQPPVAHRE